MSQGELWDDERDQQWGEGRPQGGCPVQELAAASKGFHISLSYSSNCDEGGDNHTELDDGGALVKPVLASKFLSTLIWEPMLRRFRERNRTDVNVTTSSIYCTQSFSGEIHFLYLNSCHPIYYKYTRYEYCPVSMITQDADKM